MGYLNQELYKKIEKFKDNKCPICDGAIEMDDNYKLEVDCIHFKCSNCSPSGCVISISGSVMASNFYVKILNDSNTKKYLKTKTQACNAGEVKIQNNDFTP